MKISKLKVLIYFISLRLSRLFSSNRVFFWRKRHWNRFLKKTPFYHTLLNQRDGFPKMNKSIFMENFDQLNSLNIRKEEAFAVALKSEETRDFSSNIGSISVGLSSGTSGNKGIFLTSKKEKEIWVAAILDRVIGFSFRKRRVAFFLRANNNLYESVNSKLLKFHFFDILDPIPGHCEKLLELAPEILVAQPSVLVSIAQFFENGNQRPSFKKIISVAEVLEEDQKAYLMSVFKQNIEQVYQCTEGFLAHTCSKGSLHFNEDWLKIEKVYLDESQGRFHPLITDYLRTSQILANYELNDIIHEGPKCDCGLKSTVIKKIEGRSDDVFRFNVQGNEILIFPDFIRRAVLFSSDDISNFKVVLRNSKKVMVELELNGDGQKTKIQNLVKENLGHLFIKYNVRDILIEFREFKHSSMDKFTRVKNENQKTL